MIDPGLTVDDEALVRTGFTALLNAADGIRVAAGFLLEDIGTASSPQRNRRCRRR